MQLCKLLSSERRPTVGFVRNGQVSLLNLDSSRRYRCLSDILFSANPQDVIEELIDDRMTSFPMKSGDFLAPLDRQEVWAAGVTYLRSKSAREQESQGAAVFYDKVYTAARPELFFKATAERVVPHQGRVRIRRDSRWSVPEPELALFLSPDLRIVGYSIGNDMSARDIEGENPLYLPQAKIYDQSCAIGPAVTLADSFPQLDLVTIDMVIERHGHTVFQGSTPLTRMARKLEDLVAWLGRETSFPHGVVLLTGTGIVPPDDFTLQLGDVISIDVTGVGRLVNVVA
ncbi:MAG: fumarylacetoacetate hydrolase family protein [Gemmataceae bacterium]|nr:fumarylacetoacetate hydrolase family protein [Gemmataceae bacterium]